MSERRRRTSTGRAASVQQQQQHVEERKELAAIPISSAMQIQAQAAQAAAHRLQGSGLRVSDPAFQRVQREEALRLQQQQQQQQAVHGDHGNLAAASRAGYPSAVKTGVVGYHADAGAEHPASRRRRSVRAHNNHHLAHTSVAGPLSKS